MRKLSTKIRNKAVELRRKGYSLSEISAKINVRENTIQNWVKHIKLTHNQKARLKKKEIESGKKGLAKVLAARRARKASWKENLMNRTEKFKKVLHKGSDIAKLICGVLYLCEGAKYPSSNQMIFGNSDPRLIESFLYLLRENFNIDEKKFRCRIMHRYDQNGYALNRYWSGLTKVPLSQFYKSYKDKRTKGKPTKKSGYRGICAVQYNSTDLQYELQLIGESIYFHKQKAGQ